MVESDLRGELGNACVKIQNNCPTYTDTWDNIIAVRKETTPPNGSSSYEVNDYHVAKLTADGWYHKPGRTAILKFNDAPSNSVNWISEGYKRTGYFNNPTIIYDSDIVYFLYKTNHNNAYTGNYSHPNNKHYSEYRCSDCGETSSQVVGSGNTWTGNHYHSNNQHYYEYYCSICDETYWWSSICIGPPCVMPYSVPTDYEIA